MPTAIEISQTLATAQVGNRWYKVNLHVHGSGNDPAELVTSARDAEIDSLNDMVTDTQWRALRIELQKDGDRTPTEAVNPDVALYCA